MARGIRGWLVGLALVAAGVSFSGAASALKLVKGTTSIDTNVTDAGIPRHVVYIKKRGAQPEGTLAPLVVFLHFRGGDADGMNTLTRASHLVRDTGAWAMLPDAIEGKWNDNPRSDTGVDDVAFLSRQIDRAIAAYPIDPHRVYMAGFSNGAFMTLRLLCDRPGKVAAAGIVAGQLVKALNCHPERPVPLLMISGTADTRVEYDGTTGLLSAKQTAQRFVTANTCTKGPVRIDLPDLHPADGTSEFQDGWSRCTHQSPVQLITVTGGGHTWPGSHDNLPSGGTVSYDFDATLAIWDFVQSHAR